jgi:chromosome segregation ATPase
VPEEQGDRVEGRGRKLVYRAEADLLVEDLSAAGQELETILKMHKGVLANSEISSFSGAPRAGLWRVRVPADEFDAFVKALAGLGELQRSRQDIQDVTRSHSELEEQIKNMTSEAEGLRELLKKPADKLADTLAVREQLAKVTREMEGLKARLKRMQSEAEYSTVIVRLRERNGYVADAAPSFATSISRAFSDSWQTLVSAGKATALLLTMLVPWIPVLGFVVVPTWLLLLRRGRRPLATPAVGA